MGSPLEELRRLRQQGKSRVMEFDEEDGKIYDELDDREFEAVQRRRLRTDRFVVDDDGEGYIDNGEYEWESTGSPPPKKHASTKVDSKSSITALFRTTKPKPKSEPPAAKPTDLNFDDIFNNLGKNRKPANREPTIKPKSGDLTQKLSEPVKPEPVKPVKLVEKIEEVEPTEPTEPVEKIEEVEPVEKIEEPVTPVEPVAVEVEPVEPVEVDELLSEPDLSDLGTVSLDLPDLLTPVNSDDTEPFLRFFWTDYLEQNGLTLFGRTESGRSVALLVRELTCNLYFEPRPGCSFDDLYAELGKFYTRQNRESWRSKRAVMRDVFSDDKSPKEYLHVLHPYDIPFPATAGKTYPPYHGPTSRRIESLLVSRGIMGPCWLDVSSHSAANLLGYTQVSVQANARSIAKTADVESRRLGTPKLRALGVCVQTQLEAGNVHAITAIAVTVYNDSRSSNRTASIAARPPVNGFPQGFKALAQKEKIELLANEPALLNWFFKVVEVVDPDLLVGYALTDVHLASILDRALKLNVKSWPKLGRARQVARPNAASSLEVLRVTAGRLLVDLKNAFGIEVAGANCQEFNLDEMALKSLRRPRKKLPDSDGFAHTALVSMLQLKLDADCAVQVALATQMLPLSLELTQLAGSPWRATLRGSRSARNDFLLMHEFYKDGILIPERARGEKQTKRRAAQYTGGLVLDPVKGLHKPCVLVMDFNSLYPSIIQEHNICFSTVCEDGSISQEQGILPRILHSLVDRRRQVKRLMKNDAGVPAAKLAEWETRQKALKLTANSMYGCLGLKESRFAAQHLAQLTTLKGREALERARKLAENHGLQVLYGDTDSVMIQTHANTYAEAQAIGYDFKELVNKQYKCMEIDIDGVFQALLLHTKKKYAAAQLFANGDVKLEIKGLDMRRREFCDASKLVSTDVLSIVLGIKEEFRNCDPFTVFEHVLACLASFAESMRSGQLKPNMFVIRKQLSKEVNAFDAENKQPHVVVARRKTAGGEIVKAKDVIGYIFAKGVGPVSIEEMKTQDLSVDYEYYLQHQVFTPIKRLCERLDEFDEPRLANALGLQTKPRFVRRQQTAPFILKHLDHECALHDVKLSSLSTVECPACAGDLDFSDLARLVRADLRRKARTYYDHWHVCDECDCLTKNAGARCPQPRCSGMLSPLHSAEELYAHMQNLGLLFADVDAVSDVVQQFLRHSAYARVRIGDLFNVAT